MNNKKTYIRIVVDLFLFLSIFLFPWWFASALAIVALAYFSSFYEILFFGFFVGVFSGYGPNAPIYCSIAAILALCLATVMKQRLIFSK
ncbi:MAG: hypothetical protein A2653_02215 [Candidatus Zambryskibacteria bacterium RIFCSPHIGHO2_01_FULL_43_25]|uniref:Uncharacterized protein n=1 Tax=Candidatus Zambryskibacteria bacterium RIFCSPLOWO2_01_FULL_45_21 TaxID=1802761 RepID=A0A1G2U3A0_9BACT|nr:MAG: hypothetical protein A2653_02215 [Candidatus Zambryskibacteria bacterium RIFCSPHIGHO2_01_FULL_43_25]OHB01016.1 MAG: hypothetical protein A3E94_02395 [Candidatus Zambryskibacteria bacterium RIFCSPHIGHO2_12_FULL_44_12b]OHB03939.1 MAG: hypothetical protein A3B14_01235 [Candidatus Zambryskibacteria bacterium RIFCSPLOWO2_01_FULL_45_21]